MIINKQNDYICRVPDSFRVERGGFLISLQFHGLQTHSGEASNPPPLRRPRGIGQPEVQNRLKVCPPAENHGLVNKMRNVLWREPTWEAVRRDASGTPYRAAPLAISSSFVHVLFVPVFILVAMGLIYRDTTTRAAADSLAHRCDISSDAHHGFRPDLRDVYLIEFRVRGHRMRS